MLLAMLLLCINLLFQPTVALAKEISPQLDRFPETMDLPTARQYMVSLINRDRAILGLKPVGLDETASKAGQLHSDDMVVSKYTSHWDMQGRKPDQRYSEVGGQGAVSENVLITHTFVDREHYHLSGKQSFDRAELEKMEGLFFNEKAPNDGHRVNILNPAHNKVGIGLTLAEPGNRVICTQEFVNQYGSFSQLPPQHRHGSALALSGELPQGVELYSVDIRHEDAPTPMTVEQLKLTHSYTFPNDSVASYWPAPYLSPAPVKISHSAGGQKFQVEVKPTESWKPGLYYVVVWVKTADSTAPIVTSARTVAIN